MTLETFKVMREMFPPRVWLQFLMIPVALFVLGFMNAGPSLSSRMIGGLVSLAPIPFMLVGVHFFVKLRYSRVFAPFERVREQLDALSDDGIRAAAQSAIEKTTLFRAYPATSPLAPGLPPRVAEFFGVYDRLDFFLPGNPSPYFSVCRSLIGPVPNNDDAVKIGETYELDSCVAVHLITERVTCHRPPIGVGEVARCGNLRPLHYASVWHFVAQMAAFKSLEDEIGHKHIVRPRLLDKRPRWRVDGATT